MKNDYQNELHEVTVGKVMFNKKRFEDEMRIMRDKRHYNLEILSHEVHISYGYLRKEIWKNGLSRINAEKIADALGVRLEYLEGKSGIRTDQDLENFEREHLEHIKRAENRLLSCGLEYFQLLPNIDIKFVDNINVDNENEPTIGYKITFRDNNYNESTPIYKTIPEMTAFLQSMNEVIEQIIKLHALK